GRRARSPARACGSPAQRALDELGVHELEHVAFPEVLETVERHAALEARLDVLDVFVDATQARQLAAPQHLAFAGQADLGAAADDAVGDAAAGDDAELARLEGRAHLGVADDALHLFRREHAFHGVLDL